MALAESLIEHKSSRKDLNLKRTGDEKNEPSESQIKNFFKGSTIFLTGCTGFLGKLILEKTLRCCPDINKIYVLVRPKRNKTTMQRLKQLFDESLFEKLREEQPDFFQKVQPIDGDIEELNLGIKDEDRERLHSEVEIIIHGAATVRFDAPLKTAIRVNVSGTKEVLRLAEECASLKSMVHISTAFSNCNRSSIEEVFYKPPVAGDHLIEMVKCINEKTLNDITPKLPEPEWGFCIRGPGSTKPFVSFQALDILFCLMHSGKCFDYVKENARKIPSIKKIYFCFCSLIATPLLFNIYFCFVHWIPAFFFDVIAALLGKPALMKYYKKLKTLNNLLAYFGLNEWKFSNRNVQNLFNELNETDRHTFNFDIGSIDWETYFESYARGIRIYILKDPTETLPSALRRHKILKYIHYGIITLILIYVLYKCIMCF